jgi:TolB-like protein
MKKALFSIFALFAISAGLFAQQPVVAVAPFDAISGISATDANMITRVFFIRLGNTNKVSLVDRGVVERVLKEHKFQAGDWSDQQKTAELGKAFNADWIVRGELEKFGTNILVTVQFYDIRTFRFMGGADLRLANADAAYDNMDPLVNKLVETIASAGERTPRQQNPFVGRWQSVVGNNLTCILILNDDGSITVERLDYNEYDNSNDSRTSSNENFNHVLNFTGTGTYSYNDDAKILTLSFATSNIKPVTSSYEFQNNNSGFRIARGLVARTRYFKNLNPTPDLYYTEFVKFQR